MELGRHGGPRPIQSRNEQPDGHKVAQYGTGRTYLAGRLRREAPEIADRMHEFGSAAAAARAAGIPVPKPERGTLGNPETVARRIVERGPDYARAVAQSAT